MKTRDPGLQIFLLISILVWIYLFIRAIYVPMAHDEIATFHYYIQTADFLPFVAHWDMNNHIVNSALGALFYSLFGLSPFVLRLPNLLMFPLFCFYLWKTGNLIPGRIAQRAFMLTLLLSHGFLEFFSLSRGYGMSMAFLMPVLYHTIRATGEFTTRRMLAALDWGILATLANLALINTFVILCGWMLLLTWFSGKAEGLLRKLLNTLLLMGTGLPPLLFFTLISFKARELGLLYTGGSKGFFIDTVGTLLPKLTGLDNIVIYAVTALLFLFAAGYAVFRMIRERSLLLPGLVFFVFMCGNMLFYWLLNRFLHVNYPGDRVVIYLFPFFIGALCFFAGDLAERTSHKAFLLILAPLLFFPVHFVYSINLTHAEFYIEDPIPVSFYNAVKADHKAGEYPPTVGGHRLGHFCWSFNDFSNGGTESQRTFEDYPGTIEEFQVADGTELDRFKDGYRVLLRYPPNDKYLLKRNVPLQRDLLASSGPITMDGEGSDEYCTLFSGSLDTLAEKNIYIGFTGTIESPSVPFEAWIVAEARDSTGNAVCYEKLALNWLRPEWKGEASHLKNGILIANLPASVRRLQVYLWNMKKVEFEVKNFRTEIYILF
jgi:hypothetical protein